MNNIEVFCFIYMSFINDLVSSINKYLSNINADYFLVLHKTKIRNTSFKSLIEMKYTLYKKTSSSIESVLSSSIKTKDTDTDIYKSDITFSIELIKYLVETIGREVYEIT